MNKNKEAVSISFETAFLLAQLNHNEMLNGLK